MAFAFICNIAINAASPRQYLYDTKEENGKIVSKVVFLNENGLLNKEVKYEFTYNDTGKVATKKAYRWNNSSQKWDPYYETTYTYNPETGEISTVYGMWDKKTKSFTANQQTMVMPGSSYEDIFS